MHLCAAAAAFPLLLPWKLTCHEWGSQWDIGRQRINGNEVYKLALFSPFFLLNTFLYLVLIIPRLCGDMIARGDFQASDPVTNTYFLKKACQKAVEQASQEIMLPSVGIIQTFSKSQMVDDMELMILLDIYTLKFAKFLGVIDYVDMPEDFDETGRRVDFKKVAWYA